MFNITGVRIDLGRVPGKAEENKLPVPPANIRRSVTSKVSVQRAGKTSNEGRLCEISEQSYA